MTTTYNDLYLDVRQRLRKAGLPAATLEARELVCFGSGKSREELHRDGRLYVPRDICDAVEKLVQRHLRGEPVAYIIGEWEFYGLGLDISERVLIPRPDTEVLAAQAIEWVKAQAAPRVLDLCAGSGCVGLAIASQCPEARVTLGELDEGALKICRQNIRRSDLSSRVVPLQLDALQKPPLHLGEFDCIVCNPPYIPTGDIPGLDVSVRDYEPIMALDGGDDGLDFYRAVCERWTAVLRLGGRLFFEVGIGQADDVLRIMRSVGFGDITVVPDLNGIPRTVWGRLCGHADDSVYGSPENGTPDGIE